MEPADMADVLSAAAVYDGRNIGRTDVAAWHAAAGHLNRDDALAAVVRHYAASTDRMMPAHLIQGALAIRNERAALQQHEIRALPSKFEPDAARDARLAAGIAKLRERWKVPARDGDQGDVHAAALERARRDRREEKRPAPARPPRREPTPIDLAKVTTPPPWATPEARERLANEALHNAGRACGKPFCTREQCKASRAEAA